LWIIYFENRGHERGDWAMEMTVRLDDRCCDRPNNLCNDFLNILPGPAVVKGGLALKKWTQRKRCL